MLNQQHHPFTELTLIGLDDFKEGRFARLNDFIHMNSLMGDCLTSCANAEGDSGYTYYLTKLVIDELFRTYLTKTDKPRSIGVYRMMLDLDKAMAIAPSQFSEETRFQLGGGDVLEIHLIPDVWDHNVVIFAHMKEHRTVFILNVLSRDDDPSDALKRNRLLRRLIDEERQTELLTHCGLNDEQKQLVAAINKHKRLIPYDFGYWSMPDAPMKQIESGRHAGKLIPEWFFHAGTVNALVRRQVLEVTKGGCSEEKEEYEPNLEVMLTEAYSLTE